MGYRRVAMDIIKTTDALKSACDAFAKFKFVTVDTEFLRESTFWPKLCLVQMASPEHAVIIDVLCEGLDLTPFFELMRDESIVKVFHAARQDIEIIVHLAGFVPHPVFDTQVAAMVCGFGDSISYDQLVGKITGARIDKSSRFTDWSRRPLTDKQLTYALADVTHLRDVYSFLSANLAEQNRSEWVHEEMEVLTSQETYELLPENAWTRLKLRIKKSLDFAVLMKLAEWREHSARSRDVPRNRVLKDDAIYELSTQQPTDQKALSALRSIPRGFEKSRTAHEILAVIEEAKQIPADQLPKLPRGKPSPDGTSAAVDLLKVLLKMTSEENGVAAKVIATVDDLEKIAADDNADVDALKGWRRELFGNVAIEVKNGNKALAFNGRKVVLFNREQTS